MDILTTTAQNYMTTFSGFVHQFVEWGQWLFGTLLVFNLLWLWLWNAVDKENIVQGLSDFLKRFFVMLFFYSILINPSWLMSILSTAQFMGNSLTGLPIDPSSIISNGIMIANKVIIPIEKSSLLTLGVGGIVALLVYLVILYVFINIALELALAMVMTTALIAVASFFLGFAALGATTSIARQTLDVILANCVRMLGIYVVVAVGAQTIGTITASIPNNLLSFDPYVWIVAAVWLFYLLAKNFPQQLAQIVSGSVSSMQGTDAAALAMAAIRIAEMKNPALNLAKTGLGATGALVAASTAHNATAHFGKAHAKLDSFGMSTLKGASGAAVDLAKSSVDTVSDHFKHIASKLAGGSGMANKMSDIPGISERMHDAAQATKSTTDISKPYSSGSGNPSSAGKKAASPSSTHSEIRGDKSRPK